MRACMGCMGRHLVLHDVSSPPNPARIQNLDGKVDGWLSIESLPQICAHVSRPYVCDHEQQSQLLALGNIDTGVYTLLF
eukprot:jgi/Botrbrau1/4581/Bobra.60_2s0067.1